MVNINNGYHHIDVDYNDLADAIRWAYPKADVISCSFGNCEYTQDLVDAITDARVHGRNGKGTPVVCAAGNDYDTAPNDLVCPANINGVISVGAVNKNGYVCEYSQRGAGLFLTAIGGVDDIVTTDRMWSLGYDPTNYCYQFDGTSAACSQVTGVIALMLSLNPDLTEAQIRNILQNSCRKLPSYSYNSSGWSNQVGYGLIDAKAAIWALLSISGPDIPQASSSYSLLHLPSGCNVNWSWKSGNTTVPITQNSPSVNQCTINNSSKEYIVDTLVAVVSKNGSTIATFEKAIDTGAGFYGTYEQEGADYVSTYVPECPPTSFHSGDRFTLYKGPTITLWSPKFVGATFSFAGNESPSNWTHNGNTISFKFRYLPPAPLRDQDEEAALRAWILGMQVTGRYTNSYETFRFTIRPMLPMFVNPPILLISSSGNSYTFTPSGLNDEDSMSANNRSWDLLVTNTLTGRVMYSGSIRGASHTIDTSSWEEGVYAVQARVGETVLTQKFSVSK
ncbi:MAG: S8 family serine peptidase [Bacteroidaceae bacterium]|nr:S8 family serine peptidase [Bacteroidaceae bacterium]